MSTTVRIPPRSGTYDYTYLSLSNSSNVMTNVDSSTYAVYTSKSSIGATTDLYAIKLFNFNFSLVPEGATIEQIRLRLKQTRSVASSSGGVMVAAYNRNTEAIISTDFGAFSPTTVGTAITIFNTPYRLSSTAQTAWDNARRLGTDFAIAINIGRTRTANVAHNIYGAEIEVTYSLSKVNKVVYGDTTLIDLSSDSVTADSMLSGRTAHNKTGSIITGTITTNTASSVTFSNTTVTVPAGYYASQVSKTATDEDLVAENIKKDVNIFGVTGTYEGGGVESVTQDQEGYVIFDDDPGSQIVVNSLAVTSNGTYTAEEGYAYSPVTVNVPTGITPTGTLSITSNGTYDVTNYASADVSVSSTPVEKAGVRFIDYDGTILNTYTYAEAKALSALPSNPTHSGLTSQGWNWTLADIKSELEYSDGGYIDVGQMYVTDDGKTRLYIEIDEQANELPVEIGFGMSSGTTITINWGDNSQENVTNTSYTTYSHTYATYGSYIISLSVSADGQLQIGGGITNSRYPTIMGNIINTSSTTAYPADAYHNTAKLRKVEFGENVKLYAYGFRSCSKLKYITTPHSLLKATLDETFMYCYDLECFVIPDSINSVSGSTFRACESLKYIPNCLTTLASTTYVFRRCRSLGNIFFKKELYANNSSRTFDECYSLEYASFPRNTLSTNLGDYWYYNCYSLKKMVMYNDNNFSKIPNYMHAENRSLEYVEIPSGVTVIGEYAFSSCKSLKSITLPNTLTEIKQYAFQLCDTLKSITFPSTLTTIGQYAFNNCYVLDNISFPNSITYLGKNAFYNCYSLKNVDLSNTSVPSIGDYEFSSCRTLKTIKLPSGLTSIGQYAFQGCGNLDTITIPSSVTTINNSAFRECGRLESIVLPSSLTTFGTYMFYMDLYLQHVTLPTNLTTIPTYTFYYCSALESIEIPSGVTSIGAQAFTYCRALKTINLPNNVTSIGAQAFRYCNSLTSLTIPDGVTDITASCFSDCRNILAWTIPSSVTSIAASAFYQNTSVTEYHFLPETPPTLANTNAFSGILTSCVFYVPYSSDHSILEAYQTASNWSTYASQMQEEPT